MQSTVSLQTLTPSSLRQQITSEQHESAYAAWCTSKRDENDQKKGEARMLRRVQGAPLVVIVDDELVVAITLTEVLRRHGFNVVWFDAPLSALAYVEEGPVDVLLSDITMPVLDGIALATKVQALQPSCALLLLSAISDQSDIVEQIDNLDFGVHLEAKPLPIPRLIAVMQQVLPCSILAASASLKPRGRL